LDSINDSTINQNAIDYSEKIQKMYERILKSQQIFNRENNLLNQDINKIKKK
jgi:hypothetical protein